MSRWPNKYVIGLTGNIAMGKSSIRKMLEHLGAYPIDADGLSHQVLAPGAPAYQPVLEWFGKWLVDPQGRIDRSKLANIVFNYPEALDRLESLTHPIVRQGIDTLITRANQPIVVVEAIKLVDGELGEQVDSIWVVDAAPQIQLERLMKRGISEGEARRRIEAQNPQRDKLARADVVISNSGSLQDAWVQVEREWHKIMAAHGLQQTEQVRQISRTTPSTPTTPVRSSAQPPSQTAQPIQSVQSAPQPAPQAVPIPVTSVTPPSSPSAPISIPSQPVTPPATETYSFSIRRGMPKHADSIAQMINQFQGKNLTRMDIMAAFGEKSYLLAEHNDKIVGLAGFQVENLITRMDEFIILPGAPQSIVAEGLIEEVEEASKALQSEVGFMFLPQSASAEMTQPFYTLGYQRMELDEIKVPPWREAAQESQPPNTIIFAKKLRAERVLKPL